MRSVAIYATAVVALTLAPRAQAVNCTLQSASIAFGNYTGGQTLNLTGNISIYCDGGATVAVRISTGGSGSYVARKLSSAGGSLNYNLYTSNSYTKVWGDTSGGTAQVTGSRASAGTLSFTVYGRIPSGQSVPAGAFSDALTVTFAKDATLHIFSGSGAMTATASVTGSCTISAGAMPFGSFGLALATTSRSQTATLSYTCSAGTTARITLGQGQHGTGTLSSPVRYMASGSGTLSYQLYSDSGQTTVWDGVTGVSVTGTGSAQTSTVYGKTPAQAVPPAGTYTDTVVVTITF
jgi:spore coat protein U-like protein